MSLARSLGRSIGRSVMRDLSTQYRRADTYRRLQQEAASRPGSVRVQADGWDVWMSPIEHELYEAIRKEGLAPVPQLCVEGYYVDFAFPDVSLAVEADGAAYHAGERRQRDAKRDWVLRRAGWTVKRFRGTTIHQKAGNCAYVVRREVDGRRAEIALRIRQEELRRQARREALLRPLRRIARFLRLG